MAKQEGGDTLSREVSTLSRVAVPSLPRGHCPVDSLEILGAGVARSEEDAGHASVLMGLLVGNEHSSHPGSPK